MGGGVGDLGVGDSSKGRTKKSNPTLNRHAAITCVVWCPELDLFFCAMLGHKRPQRPALTQAVTQPAAVQCAILVKK